MWPVLVQIGDLKLWTYGVCLGLSCVMGGHIAVYLAARSGIPERKAWAFAVTVIAVGILGGRLHDVAINAPDLATFFREIVKLEHSGRTAYGAFLAGTIAAVVAGPLLKVGFWRFADAAAPTMALGLGLTRVGCFFYGCDYGARSDAWGVCFPQGSPAWADQVEAKAILPTAARSLPVLPIQLAESFVGFAIGGLCVWAWFRRPRREGSILLLFFFAYGLCRALLEVWRDDAGRGTLLGLSTSMTIGLVTAATAAVLASPALAKLRPMAGEILPPPSDEPAPEAR